MLKYAFDIVANLLLQLRNMCNNVSLLGAFTLWHLIIGGVLISFIIPIIGMLFKLNYLNTKVGSQTIIRGKDIKQE